MDHTPFTPLPPTPKNHHSTNNPTASGSLGKDATAIHTKNNSTPKNHHSYYVIGHILRLSALYPLCPV